MVKADPPCEYIFSEEHHGLSLRTIQSGRSQFFSAGVHNGLNSHRAPAGVDHPTVNGGGRTRREELVGDGTNERGIALSHGRGSTTLGWETGERNDGLKCLIVLGDIRGNVLGRLQVHGAAILRSRGDVGKVHAVGDVLRVRHHVE